MPVQVNLPNMSFFPGTGNPFYLHFSSSQAVEVRTLGDEAPFEIHGDNLPDIANLDGGLRR